MIVMDIFEYAMQMEKDGEAYYRELAAKSGEQGLSTILDMLAADEVKHYRALQEMQRAAGAEMAGTEVLANAKNVFAQMRGQTFDLDVSQIELYQKAQEIERRSQEFYAEKAKEVSNPAHEKLFLQIAEEEERHYFLLDHVIEFVSRPQTWIEDAEFTHLDEY
jgi:rubrerythrin